jgi:hypothetical protein
VNARLVPPKGVSRATYEAAVHACGGNAKAPNSVASKIDSFRNCMRAHGVNIPPPGKGEGLLAYLGNVNSPNYPAALHACRGLLSGATPSG